MLKILSVVPNFINFYQATPQFPPVVTENPH